MKVQTLKARYQSHMSKSALRTAVSKQATIAVENPQGIATKAVTDSSEDFAMGVGKSRRNKVAKQKPQGKRRNPPAQHQHSSTSTSSATAVKSTTGATAVKSCASRATQSQHSFTTVAPALAAKIDSLPKLTIGPAPKRNAQSMLCPKADYILSRRNVLRKKLEEGIPFKITAMMRSISQQNVT